MYEYLKRVIVINNNVSTIYIHSWTSKGLSNEKITAPGASNSNDQAQILEYDGREMSLKFSGDLLRQPKITYNHGPKVPILLFTN